jgi:diguanylate cyclase (GGDEF)-like protein
MRLTVQRIVPTTGRVWSRFGIAAAILTSMLVIFALDQRFEAAPLQHLYYVPVIMSAVWLGTPASLLASLVAVVLYHLANPPLWTWRYGQADFVQIALFLAVGLVTSRLTADARRFRHLAETDDLTGLHNLRSFETALNSTLKRARATRRQVSLLVIDVDRLKSLNDAYGHLAGAEAVRTVGQLIGAGLPEGGVACRYGGDEFAIVLDASGPATARAVADRLRSEVHAAAPVLDGTAFPAGTLSISVGAASWWPGAPQHDLPYADEGLLGEALFKAADRALYLSKGRGRNLVSVA